jgi:hypothetical protein
MNLKVKKKTIHYLLACSFLPSLLLSLALALGDLFLSFFSLDNQTLNHCFGSHGMPLAVEKSVEQINSDSVLFSNFIPVFALFILILMVFITAFLYSQVKKDFTILQLKGFPHLSSLSFSVFLLSFLFFMILSAGIGVLLIYCLNLSFEIPVLYLSPGIPFFAFNLSDLAVFLLLDWLWSFRIYSPRTLLRRVKELTVHD